MQPLAVEFDHERALAQGNLDVVIGNWPNPPLHLHLSLLLLLLLEDEIVCLTARDATRGQGTA